ncbi:MAG: hypothetical protein M1409_06905 [Actinobacteria bacterium]|nr:hypothetical protein [Actinomycetota bacterium]
MIKPVLKKYKLQDTKQQKDTLFYWLSRPAEERIYAVEHLRSQYYGNSIRFQRSVRIVKQIQSRKKDLADLESLGE